MACLCQPQIGDSTRHADVARGRRGTRTRTLRVAVIVAASRSRTHTVTFLQRASCWLALSMAMTTN